MGRAVDVTVRGAGIFGLAVAWACIRRGARVRIIDPGGVGAGASGGILGALAPHSPENWNATKAFQLAALIAAEAFWGRVARAGGGDPGYARTGRLQPIAGAAAEERARHRAAGADAHWQGHGAWRVVRASDLGDWAPTSPSGLLIHDTLSARLHPRCACNALARAVAAGGGEIAAQGPDGGATVWATGHLGLRALSRAFGAPIGDGVKGQAALLQLDRRTAPQIFAEALHVVPHGDGTTAVGATTEREFDRPNETDGRLDALIARARALVPAIGAAPVIARWAGVRPRSRSLAPILGAWPGRPGHFIANGGFKIGLGLAPRAGEVMAELILEGRDAIPPGFRLEAALDP